MTTRFSCALSKPKRVVYILGSVTVFFFIILMAYLMSFTTVFLLCHHHNESGKENRMYENKILQKKHGKLTFRELYRAEINSVWACFPVPVLTVVTYRVDVTDFSYIHFCFILWRPISISELSPIP